MAYAALPSNFDSLNDADKNTAAIKAGYTGYQDYLDQKNRGLSNNSSSGNIASSTSYNYDDLNKAISNAVSQYKTSIEPAVSTLNSTTDTITSKYDALLSSIKGSQTAAENKQTATTNAELAKRGISSDSGVAQNEIAQALQPVTAQYNQLYANTGVSQANALSAIKQAIANLQSGAATTGLTTGANTYTSAIEAALKALTATNSSWS